MTIFTYKNPVLRGSTKTLDIFNNNQEKVGSIQRVFRNRLQKVFDLIFGSQFIINVNAFDVNNELACEISEILGKTTLVKSKWNGKSTNLGDFTLFDRTKITTNPRWEIQTNEGNYRIEKNLGNKKVLIKEENGGNIAEISYDIPIPPQNITLQLHSKKLNHLEVAALYLLINIKY